MPYLRSKDTVASLDTEGKLLMYISLIDTQLDPGGGELILEAVLSSFLFSWALILESVPL